MHSVFLLAFRDGVSEGQCSAVLQYELLAIRYHWVWWNFPFVHVDYKYCTFIR